MVNPTTWVDRNNLYVIYVPDDEYSYQAMISRDSKGAVLVASIVRNRLGSAYRAEKLATKLAMVRANEMGYKDIIWEGDCKESIKPL